MSAQFIVRFRGQPVRFTYQTGKQIYEIVPRGMASVFIAEADAWHAAMQHQMRADCVSVAPITEENEEA